MSKWRDEAAPIISRILTENPDKSEGQLKALIWQAFPHEKGHRSQKYWAEELNAQMYASPRSVFSRRALEKAGQGSMFTGVDEYAGREF